MKNNTVILKQIVRELKSSIDNVVGQTVLDLLHHQNNILYILITTLEPLDLLKL